MLNIFQEFTSKFLKKMQSRKKEPKNLKEVLAEIEALKKSLKTLSDEVESLRNLTLSSVQKIGLVRFNPFNDIGGDQSFSVALLDFNNNGFVITNIYAKDRTRIYAKPVKEGASPYSLAEEEKEAITRAISSQILNPKFQIPNKSQ